VSSGLFENARLCQRRAGRSPVARADQSRAGASGQCRGCPMKILVYSYYNAKTIAGSMGLPDYSYYFVLKDFLPVLRELGEVIVVEHEQDIQSACQQARGSGQPSLFLSFTPPHKTPL